MTQRFLLPSIIGLLSILQFDAIGHAQDPTDDRLVHMKLSPVVVQDFSGSVATSAASSGQYELPAPTVRNPPVERIIGRGNTPIDDSRMKRLRRLNRPISQLGVDGINLSDSVSQLSFTNDDERYITSSEIRSLDSLESQTTYTRRPLYFEHRNLERCGESQCITCRGILTNPHCLGKFLVDTALVPFRMIRKPPCKPVVSAAH